MSTCNVYNFNMATNQCLQMVIDHHPELTTLKQRLELTEKLFQYLDTGEIPE